jgi:hypothetical protein
MQHKIWRHKTWLVIVLGLFALSGWETASEAAERKGVRTAGPAAGQHKAIVLRKRAQPGRYPVMRGGYSYGRSEVATHFGYSRGPWETVGQSPGGPFDSGFFFDSGIAPLNNAPYPR